MASKLCCRDCKHKKAVGWSKTWKAERFFCDINGWVVGVHQCIWRKKE